MRGIAQLTRSGWYRAVEVKSIASHEVRLLLGARSQLVSTRTGLYNQIRGVLKTFGVVLPPGTRSAFENSRRATYASDIANPWRS